MGLPMACRLRRVGLCVVSLHATDIPLVVSRAAAQHAWDVLEGESEHVEQAVMNGVPRAVMVVIGRRARPAAGLLARQARRIRPPALFAIAIDESGIEDAPRGQAAAGWAERLTRLCGAQAYMHAGASQETLELIVEALAPGCVRQDAAAHAGEH